MPLYIKHSSPLFRDNNISTGCYGDQELALVHTKIFFNKDFHRHLVIHMPLSAECKNTPVKWNVRKLMQSVRRSLSLLLVRCVLSLYAYCSGHSHLSFSWDLTWSSSLPSRGQYNPNVAVFLAFSAAMLALLHCECMWSMLDVSGLWLRIWQAYQWNLMWLLHLWI